MSEEKIEEETYSLIFKSLKHPIRRKILRILVDKQLAFSKILDILSIDSGHLSYHLENLGGLIKRSANGKYGLSSIGIAAVDLMSGVEERPQMLTLTGKFRSKKIRNVLMGVVLAILIMSAAFNIYYYSLSQELNGKFYNSKGALSGVATAFDHSLHYAILILESEPTPENLYDLVMYFRYHIQSAMVLIDAFQWLLPSYKDSFRIIKSSLLDIVLGPKEGPAGGVEWVLTALNVSMAIDAFKELKRNLRKTS